MKPMLGVMLSLTLLAACDQASNLQVATASCPTNRPVRADEVCLDKPSPDYRPEQDERVSFSDVVVEEPCSEEEETC